MNVDAENRNNVEQQPVRHTSNRIRNIIRINRRCSFCNSNTHTTI